MTAVTDLLYSGQDLVDMLMTRLQAEAQRQLEDSAEIGYARTTTAGFGSNGGGGLSMRCQICGKQATRPECMACNMTRLAGGQDLANFSAKARGPATFAESVERIMAAGRAVAQQHDAHVKARAARPAEPPPVRHCACGQELREVLSKRRDSRCGDCRASVAKGETQLGEVVRPAPLDDRIAAAQPKAVDADPTQAWGAGATPSYDWEGR